MTRPHWILIRAMPAAQENLHKASWQRYTVSDEDKIRLPLFPLH